MKEKADSLVEGSIPRTKVAQVAVESLTQANAHIKIVEVVARSEAPSQSFETLFAKV